MKTATFDSSRILCFSEHAGHGERVGIVLARANENRKKTCLRNLHCRDESLFHGGWRPPTWINLLISKHAEVGVSRHAENLNELVSLARLITILNWSRISLALVSKRAMWGNTVTRPRTHSYFANGDECMPIEQRRDIDDTLCLGIMPPSPNTVLT